jgi:UDP-2,3-diacylglucosamine hydrolase
MLDERFAEAGSVRVIAGGLSFKLGEKSCIALHGDELCWNDRPYQRSKRVLRNPFTRLILRNLPLSTAMSLGRRARTKSQQSIRQGDQSRFAPVKEAVADAFGANIDLLIFGHIHEAARGIHEGMGEYCVLPAFDESGVHLEAKEGDLAYRSLEGRILPDAQPRSFPAFQG